MISKCAYKSVVIDSRYSSIIETSERTMNTKRQKRVTISYTCQICISVMQITDNQIQGEQKFTVNCQNMQKNEQSDYCVKTHFLSHHLVTHFPLKICPNLYVIKFRQWHTAQHHALKCVCESYEGLGGIWRDLLKLKRSLTVMLAWPYFDQSGRPWSKRYWFHRLSSDAWVRKRSPTWSSNLRRSHQHW